MIHIAAFVKEIKPIFEAHISKFRMLAILTVVGISAAKS